MIEVIRQGAFITVRGLSDTIREQAKVIMSYQKQVQDRGKFGKRVYQSVTERMWMEAPDPQGGLTLFIFQCGFRHRFFDLLSKHGIKPEQVHEHRIDRQTTLVPDTTQLSTESLRPEQKKMLSVIHAHDGGIIVSPTGSGKSFAMREICMMYPDATFLIGAPTTAIVNTLVRYLSEIFGKKNVGQLGGGKRNTQRLTVSTYNSMQKHADLNNIDILLVDECHRSAGNSYKETLAALAAPIKRFAFTASLGNRSDKADIALEGLFGPVRVEVEFQASVANGSVVPVHMHTYENPFPDRDYPPEFNLHEFIKSKEAGDRRNSLFIWHNKRRIQFIKDVIAKELESAQYENPQVLMLCTRTEQALAMHKHFPEATLVHGPLSTSRREALLKKKLIEDKNYNMTTKQKDALISGFEAGEGQFYISTDVMGTGVSSNDCQIVVFLETPALNGFIQGVGRAVRRREGKTHAVCVLIRDTFYSGYKSKVRTVLKEAEKQGHTLVECKL